MLNLFLSTFVTLFVIIDPPGCAPIFAGLTRDATHKQAFRIALRATVIAGLILLMFATVGRKLLDAMHIEMDSFRIAGGLMLFLIALDMVFETHPAARGARRKGAPRSRARGRLGVPDGDADDCRAGFDRRRDVGDIARA